MTGHTEKVNSLAFSNDSKLIVTGSNDKTVRVWDVETGKELHRFKGHTAKVWSVCFSPDGRFVASGGDDMTAKVWDLKTNELIAEFKGHLQRVHSVAFHPDGKRVLTGCCDHMLRLWNIEKEAVVGKFRHDDCVRNILISKDGSRVCTRCAEGDVNLWNLDTGNSDLTISYKNVDTDHVQMLPDASKLFLFTSKGLAVFNNSGEQVGDFPVKWFDFKEAAIHPEGSVAAILFATAQVAQIINLDTGKVITSTHKFSDGINELVAFSPDGKYLLCSMYFGPTREKPGLYLWDCKALLSGKH
jgi:WD40 repeat protein